MNFFSEFGAVVKTTPSDGKYSKAFPASDADAESQIAVTRQNITQYLIREENKRNAERADLSQRSRKLLFLSDQVRERAKEEAGQYVKFKQWAASRASDSLRASLQKKD